MINSRIAIRSCTNSQVVFEGTALEPNGPDFKAFALYGKSGRIHQKNIMPAASEHTHTQERVVLPAAL